MEKLRSASKLTSDTFKLPNIDGEIGEIERVANTLFKASEKESVLNFIQTAQSASLTELTEELWKDLENTDSFNIPYGDWHEVARHAYHGGDSPRDWQTLKHKMESGTQVDAPMLIRTDDKLHLVSGNTRLMVARALGIRPKVLLVDMRAR